MIQFRGQHAATLLNDGRVLLSGGDESNPAAELFDPVSNTFTATGSMTTTRKVLSAERLSDGSVLVVGGQTEEWGGGWYTVPTATMERYRPATGTFVPAGSMEARRYTPHLVTSGSTVLIIGGWSQGWMSNDSIEFYQLGTVPALATTSLPDGQSGSPYPTTTLTATAGSGGPYQNRVGLGCLAEWHHDIRRADGNAVRHAHTVGNVHARVPGHRRRLTHEHPIADVQSGRDHDHQSELPR